MPLSPKVTRSLERFGPLLALVVLACVYAALEYFLVEPDSRRFLTLSNLNNILGQWSITGIVAIGMTFVILLGGIDLSVGSQVALAGGVAILSMNKLSGWMLPTDPDALAAVSESSRAWLASLAVTAACVVCIVGGTILGFVNGLLVGKGRIAPFIATLGTLVGFRSIILAFADSAEIRSGVPQFGTFGRTGFKLDGWGVNGSDVDIRLAVFVFIGLALAAHLVLTRTVFGRRVYAVGDNAQAARYAGIPVPQTTVLAYTIAGLCCGIAAMLTAARFNSVASGSTALMMELDAIAAVVIGGTRLQGGVGRIGGTVIGVLILGLIQNMLNMLSVPDQLHGLVKGLVIIAAVFLQPKKPGT